MKKNMMKSIKECGFGPPVCYFCASKDELKIEDGTYPYSASCGTQRPLPSKRKHNLWKVKQSKKQKKLFGCTEMAYRRSLLKLTR